MTIDASQVGRESAVYEVTHDWRDLALYALSIGARREDLAYVYEGGREPLRTIPTYASIPAFVPVRWLMEDHLNIKLEQVVHGAQLTTAHRALPPGGSTLTKARVDAIYDLKRFAQVILTSETSVLDPSVGAEPELAVTTRWTIIVRDEGRFGGPRPPREPSPKVPKDREPDWMGTFATSPEQALLYRLCGDFNPLHADPEAARQVGFERGPILHGLATYGIVAWTAARAMAGGEVGRLKVFAAQFKKPVWPGETIVTRGWHLEDGQTVLQAHVEGRPDPVVTNAWVEFSDATSA
ncbi:MAG: MaoC/PaaZ C-terminal domain-containing protein [Myxococcota bacterium]